MIRKGSYIFGIKVLTILFNTLLYLAIAKQLSPDDFGLFSIIMALTLFCVVIAKQGLEQAVVKIGANLDAKCVGIYLIGIVKHALGLMVVIALILYSLTLLLPDLFQLPLISALDYSYFVLFAMLFQALTAVISSVIRSQELAIASTLFSGFTAVSVSLLLMAYYEVESIDSVLSILLVGFISAFISASIYFQYKFNFLQIVKNTSSSTIDTAITKTVDTSKVLMVVAIAAYITQQFGVIVLSITTSLSDIALFSLAAKISLLMAVPLYAVNAITSPMYAKLSTAKDIVGFKSLAKKTTFFLAGIATLAYGVFFLIAEYGLVMIDPFYSEASLLLKILLIGQWFNLATGSVVTMLIMSGYERLHRRNTLVITGINVALLFAFIPSYGVIAAAVVTSVIMASKNIVALYFVNKLIYQKHGA